MLLFAPSPLWTQVRPRPERPDDGLLGKGVFKIQLESPPEIADLARDVHADRAIIALWAWLLLAILAAVAMRYVCGGLCSIVRALRSK